MRQRQPKHSPQKWHGDRGVEVSDGEGLRNLIQGESSHGGNTENEKRAPPFGGHPHTYLSSLS